MFLNHGANEIFEIYRKFVYFCLPNSKSFAFYTKTQNTYGRVSIQYIIEFNGETEKTLYFLDLKTGMFSRSQVIEQKVDEQK